MISDLLLLNAKTTQERVVTSSMDMYDFTPVTVADLVQFSADGHSINPVANVPAIDSKGAVEARRNRFLFKIYFMCCIYLSCDTFYILFCT